MTQNVQAEHVPSDNLGAVTFEVRIIQPGQTRSDSFVHTVLIKDEIDIELAFGDSVFWKAWLEFGKSLHEQMSRQ